MASGTAGSLQNRGAQQWAGLMNIPGGVLGNWPVFFSFGVVHYIKNMVLSAIPSVGGGTAGMILNAAVTGASEVIEFVAWDELKCTY